MRNPIAASVLISFIYPQWLNNNQIQHTKYIQTNTTPIQNGESQLLDGEIHQEYAWIHPHFLP